MIQQKYFMYKIKNKNYYVLKMLLCYKNNNIISKLQNKLKNQRRGLYKRPGNRPNVRFETKNSQF